MLYLPLGGRVRTIGLTGGIGVGKGEVAGTLAKLGAAIVNADDEGHQVYLQGTEGRQRVVAQFGREVLAADGEVDRRKLAQRVFSDNEALQRLNAALHPLIRERVEAKLMKLGAAGTAVAVLEAPLLLQAGWKTLVDEVWLVTSPEESVLERVRLHRGMSASEARSRIAAQVLPTDLAAAVDVVIENTGTVVELHESVQRLWHERNLT